MSTIKNLPNRLRSALVGAFILVAYAMLVSTVTDSRAVVMIADVISGAAVIAIAVLMYPLFRGRSAVLPLAYQVLKWAEGLLMVAAGVLFLIPANQGLRNTIYEGPQYYAFIVSGGLFYVLLRVRRLVPRYITIWGMVSIGVLAVSAILDLAGQEVEIMEYASALIITNEVYLAIWLFAKGLRVTKQARA